MNTSENGEYVIEKGIPIPDRGIYGRVARCLSIMTSGDSVLVDSPKYAGWNAASKRTGIPIRSHQEGNGKVRIWRIG